MHRAGHSSAVNQKSWQQGDTAEEDQAPDPSLQFVAERSITFSAC